jgi:hypothetical protein
MLRRGLPLCAVLALTLALFSSGPASAAGKVDETGVHDGARFKIDIPANWNGTLVLYSHGYVPPCNPTDPMCNPPRDAGDPFTGQYLLDHGYALAGSAYKTSGWAVQDALHDQISLLNYFERIYGEPERTIAWTVGAHLQSRRQSV